MAIIGFICVLLLSLVPLGFIMLYFAFKYAPFHVVFSV